VPDAVRGSGLSDRVVWTLGDGARFVEADPGLLDRVLSNLVENAVRHQRGEQPVRIVTSRHRDLIEIRVSDTGPGIPQSERHRVFQPFQRHGDSGIDGLGLGLAVARGLMEAMGGALEPEDTPGGGLTMVVSLPDRSA
jgi:two-component system sensor histidine kinase KdpD